MEKITIKTKGEMSGAVEMMEMAITELDMAEWNPNAMDVDKFNALFENMREVGVIEPIVVAPMNGRYLVVGGHHRLQCAKLLDYETVPVVVRHGMTQDDIKVQNMRLNVLKGKIDPAKFTAMYEELSNKFPDQDVAAMLGITSKSELEKMIIQAGKSLPPEMQDAFEKAKSRIKTVEDLVLVLNQLFERQGQQLDVYGYMILDFNDKEAVWLRMGKPDMKHMHDLAEACIENSVSMDSVVREWLTSVANVSQEDWDAMFGHLPKVALNPTSFPIEDNVSE